MIFSSREKEKIIKTKYDKNFFVFFNKQTGTKIRFSFSFNNTQEKYEKSSAPELVDIKITDYCPFGCEFCYMASNLKGKHADLIKVKKTLDLLSNIGVFEVAIGGGEPTLHPNITEIIEYGHNLDLTINLTTYNKKIFNNKKILDQFLKRKISSIGFSINKISDVDDLVNITNFIQNKLTPKNFFFVKDFIVAHIILGAHSYENFHQMIEKCLENDIRILFLGPKYVGLGKNYKFYDLSKQMMYIKLRYDNSLQKKSNSKVEIKMFSIDTKFIQLAYLEELKNYFDVRKIDSRLITPEEGKFSMYIDCVENLMAPSSYCEKNEMDKLEFNQEKFLEIWQKY